MLACATASEDVGKQLSSRWWPCSCCISATCLPHAHQTALCTGADLGPLQQLCQPPYALHVLVHLYSQSCMLQNTECLCPLLAQECLVSSRAHVMLSHSAKMHTPIVLQVTELYCMKLCLAACRRYAPNSHALMYGQNMGAWQALQLPRALQ